MAVAFFAMFPGGSFGVVNLVELVSSGGRRRKCCVGDERGWLGGTLGRLGMDVMGEVTDCGSNCRCCWYC